MSETAAVTEYSVLMLEDNPNDAFLIRHELERSGFRARYTMVSDEAAFRAALGTPFDIILADYHLPQFDAPAALRLLQNASLDIPFIVISGTVGEETAVKIIKEGATDYLLKDRLSRLPLAIEQALRSRSMTAQHRATEERYRMLIDGARDAIFTLGADGRIRSLNRAFEQSTGWAATEWIGRVFLELIHPEDRSFAAEYYEKGMRGEVLPVREYRIVTSSGAFILTEVLTTYLKVDGVVDSIIGIARDVTERRETEKQLAEVLAYNKTIIDHSPIGLITYDAAGYVKSANDAVIRMVGGTREELMRQNFRRLTSWKESGLLAKAEESLRTGAEQIFETHITTSFGKELWLSCRFVPFAFGAERHLLAHFIDVTGRKQDEERIRVSEERYRTLFDSLDEGFAVVELITDTDGNALDYRFLETNPSFYKHTGLPVDPLGKRIREIVPEHEEYWFTLYGTVARTGVPQRIQAPAFASQRLYDVFSFRIGGAGSRKVGILFSDVTEQKRAEEALRLTEQRLLMVVNNAPITIFATDARGIFTLHEGKGLERVGMRSGENVGTNGFDLFGTLPFLLQNGRVTTGGDVLRRVLAGEKIQGTTELNGVVFENQFAPIVDKEGRIDGIVAVAIDVTERRETEDALRRSEERYRKIVELSPIGIVNVSTDGHYLSANPAAQKIFGYTERELMSLRFDDITLPEDRSIGMKELQRMREGGIDRLEIVKRYRHGSGSVLWARLTISAVRNERRELVSTVALVEDITERKQFEERQKELEAQIFQSQKLEAIGTLAGGIAHDFNNILGIIMAHVSFLPNITADRVRHDQSVEAVLKAVRRGAGLVKQMLTFARKTEMHFESVRMKEIVDELTPLLQETFPKIITITVAIAEDLPPVHGDKTQLHQILLNLCVNARDAMLPEGGELRITVRCVAAETVRNKGRRADAEQYVELAVADTGIGMDKETLDRIFHPFFTTKEAGKGTGLGLSTVYGIVERHRAVIITDSMPGAGTTFTIYFPVGGPASTGTVRSEREEETGTDGSETLLIVEDETMLREMVDRLLVSKGYTVLTAEDGERGLAAFMDHHAKIDLVITDLGLPKMTGEMLIRRIKETGADVPILVTSGFIEPETKARITELGVNDILAKPYDLHLFLRTIRQVFDRI